MPKLKRAHFPSGVSCYDAALHYVPSKSYKNHLPETIIKPGKTVLKPVMRRRDLGFDGSGLGARLKTGEDHVRGGAERARRVS